MQQFCQYGSVRGATGNRRPYRDNSYTPFEIPIPRLKFLYPACLQDLTPTFDPLSCVTPTFLRPRAITARAG